MADENKSPDSSSVQEMIALANSYAATHPTAYDTDTREPTIFSGQSLAEALIKGSASYKAGVSVPVISPQGVPGSVPSERVREALGAGYHLDDPNNMAARKIVKEHPDWSALVTTLHGASEGLGGIPEALASPFVEGLDHPVIKAIQQQAAIQHPNLALSGRVAGEVLPAITGLGEVGGVARGVESAVAGGARLAEAEGAEAVGALAKGVARAEKPVAEAVAGAAKSEVTPAAVEGAETSWAAAAGEGELMPPGTGARAAAEAGAGSAQRVAQREWEAAEWFSKTGKGAPFTAGARDLERAGLDGLAAEAEASFHPPGTSLSSLTGAPTSALEKAGPGLGRQILGRAANFATQGVITSGPQAAGQLFRGDGEQAAETLLWGAVGGAVFGGLEGLGVAGAGKVSHYLERAMSSDRAADTLAKAAGKAVGYGGKALGGAVGGAAFGHAGAGALVGAGLAGKSSAATEEFVKDVTSKWLQSEGAQVARKSLKEMAKDPFGSPLGQLMAQQGNSVYEQALAKVPGILGALAGGEAPRVLTADAQKSIEERSPKSHSEALEQFKKDSEHINRIANNADHLTDVVSAISHTINTDEHAALIASMLQMKTFNIVKYLHESLPKPVLPPSPFTKEQTWQPTPQQLAQWNVIKAVAMDPLIVFQKLQDGTVTKGHTIAMQKIYPTLFRQLQKAVIQTSAHPKAPALSYQHRVKLSMLLDTPLDASLANGRVSSTQAEFAAAREGTELPNSQGGGVVGGMPSKGVHVDFDAFPDPSTVAQRISQKGSQPKKIG